MDKVYTNGLGFVHPGVAKIFLLRLIQIIIQIKH